MTDEEPVEGGGNQETLLLFSPGGDERMAVPLSAVARLEEFEPGDIERTGGREVVQYRGRILPLYRVASAFGSPMNDAADYLQIIVFSEGDRSAGLVVDRILDIVHEDIQVQKQGLRPCIEGQAVVKEHITDLVDLEALVRNFDPGFFEKPIEEPIA